MQRKYFKFAVFGIFGILLSTLAVFLVSKNIGQKTQTSTKATWGNPYTSVVTISDTTTKPISKYLWGLNFFLDRTTTTALDNYMNNFNKPALNGLGITNIRFNGGCHGDSFDWKTKTVNGRDVSSLSYIEGGVQKNTYSITIDEALAFAQSIGAELIYQVNVETLGLTNPCGFTPTYPTGTQTQRRTQLAADLSQFLNEYSDKVKIYELGNEPWGPWNPTNYVSEAGFFANIIKNFNPTLTVSIVGYPTTGNNQDGTNVSSSDEDWTEAVQNALSTTCNGVPCFNYVTDHMYAGHGYSDPNLWKFPDPIPDAPDQNTPIPKNQFIYFTFVNGDGKSFFYYMCPINFVHGGIKFYECTWFQNPVNIANLRGTGGSESYSGYDTYTYFTNNQQKLAQSFIDATVANQGKLEWSRTCPVDPNSGIDAANCTPWISKSLTNLTGSGNESYTGSDTVVFTRTSSNKQKLRQRMSNGTNVIKEQTCDFTNGTRSNCTAWTSIDFQLGNIIELDSLIYFAYADPPQTKQTLQYVIEYAFKSDKKNVSYRVCLISNDQFNCTQPYRTANFDALRGVGGETYIGIGAGIVYSNNNNLIQFPYNIPGLASYSAGQDMANRFIKRLDDYSPYALGLTEWNALCWASQYGTKRNLSLGTVDHGLMIAETFLQMAKNGVKYSQLHTITHQSYNDPYTNGCSLFKVQNSTTATYNITGEAFALTSVLANTTLLSTTQIGAPTIALPVNNWCSGTNCVKGGTSESKLSVYSARNPNSSTMYVFLINKDTQNQANTTLQLNVNNGSNYHTYQTKTLDGSTGITHTEFTPTVTTAQTYIPQTVIIVPPSSITRVTLTTSTPPSPLPTPTPLVASASPSSIPQASPSPSVQPSASPLYTLNDLRILLSNYTSTNDSKYFPKDNKVNMLDASFVIKNIQ